MNHYAGLDVSLGETTICIVDETGRIVKELKALSEPPALIAAIGGLGLLLERVELEACSLAAWLHDSKSRFGALEPSGTPRFARASSIVAGRAQDLKITVSMSAVVAVGSACSSKAANPAIWGATIELPLMVAKPQPGTQERMPTPGATKSGTMVSAGRSKCWLLDELATRP